LTRWNTYSKPLGFWTLFITHNSKKLEKTKFWKLDMFLPSGEGKETPTILGPLERANLNHRLALSKGPNRVDVSLPSPEDRNRSTLQIVF
jgi:hypothetical protein